MKIHFGRQMQTRSGLTVVNATLGHRRVILQRGRGTSFKILSYPNFPFFIEEGIEHPMDILSVIKEMSDEDSGDLPRELH